MWSRKNSKASLPKCNVFNFLECFEWSVLTSWNFSNHWSKILKKWNGTINSCERTFYVIHLNDWEILEINGDQKLSGLQSIWNHEIDKVGLRGCINALIEISVKIHGNGTIKSVIRFNLLKIESKKPWYCSSNRLGVLVFQKL